MLKLERIKVLNNNHILSTNKSMQYSLNEWSFSVWKIKLVILISDVHLRKCQPKSHSVLLT